MSRYNNNKIYNLSEEKFREIISNSVNITDALRKIGYTNPRANRSRTTLKDRIIELGIDISHFSQSNRSFKPKGYYDLEEILVVNSVYTNMAFLKTRLIKENVIPHENCALCGISRIWNNKPLNFHLDHINGVNDDNRKENIRFICPNCHSQTDTYAGRNRNY